LNIWIQDTSSISLKNAIDLWSVSLPVKCIHTVNILNSKKIAPEVFDLVIVSTNACVRPEVVQLIDKKYQVRHWILEKVLAQSEEGINTIVNVIGDRPAWVNTPMHLWSLYVNLLAELPLSKPINMVISNFEGLACSSIHFIDFVARCNSSKVISIDSDRLDHAWVESKRQGFMEVNGELSVFFSDGSTLYLIGNKDAPYHYMAKISCDGEIWEVNAEEGFALSNLGKKIYGRVEFQSELTCSIVDSIFSNGTCELPTLNESAQQHRIFLNALLKHWCKWKGKNFESIPIT
jgi:hypothetical protein